MPLFFGSDLLPYSYIIIFFFQCPHSFQRMFDGRNQIMYNYNNGSQYIRTGSFQICQEYCRECHWIFIKSMFQVRILKNLANTFEKKYKRIGSNPVCNFGILRVLAGLYILILLNVQGLIRFQKKIEPGLKFGFGK